MLFKISRFSGNIGEKSQKIQQNIQGTSKKYLINPCKFRITSFFKKALTLSKRKTTDNNFADFS
ncbi:CAAX amino terminal protease family protein [Neochlamydia sp. S13]|nr:CAAX amino terminal protease family protein [Neochlamydia sp. S13]